MLPAAEKVVLVLEAIGDDKIRVNSSSLDQPLTILPDQAMKSWRSRRRSRLFEKRQNGARHSRVRIRMIRSWARVAVG
jgi:uncharacterized protein